MFYLKGRGVKKKKVHEVGATSMDLENEKPECAFCSTAWFPCEAEEYVPTSITGFLIFE